MIDVHSHILYGIDDGAKSLEDSIGILEKARKYGINKIFVTPHYIEESKYMCNNKGKKKILDELQEKFPDIELYMGNEIYINNHIHEHIEKGEISPLGNSKYLLIELPIYNEFPGLEDYLFKLRTMGYKIIIAHPERYNYFKEDFDKLLGLCKQGIYFQGNYMSLYDTYGKTTRKMFIKILKHHCYTFMASDVHRTEQKYYKKVKEAKDKIISMTSKEYAENIFDGNASKIMTGEEIEIRFKERLSLFDRIRGN